MRFSIYILLLLCISSSCSQSQDKTTQKIEASKPYTYLALGDSYTIGESVPKEMRWPVQLAAQFKKAGLNVDAPRIIATTGWTTDELIKAIDENKISEQYDMVSLLIGVNNQYRGYPIATYTLEFKDLLSRSIRLAGGANMVFVVSIPDYGVTPFGQKKDAPKIASEIDQYNSIAKEICEQKGIKFINITDLSKKALSDSLLVAVDGLHPSGKMYTEWVERIFPEVKEGLE